MPHYWLLPNFNGGGSVWGKAVPPAGTGNRRFFYRHMLHRVVRGTGQRERKLSHAFMATLMEDGSVLPQDRAVHPQTTFIT